ncbi:hypothetical protein HDV57DRAFT_479206 [Trichoderma longibrachiatum]
MPRILSSRRLMTPTLYSPTVIAFTWVSSKGLTPGPGISDTQTLLRISHDFCIDVMHDQQLRLTSTSGSIPARRSIGRPPALFPRRLGDDSSWQGTINVQQAGSKYYTKSYYTSLAESLITFDLPRYVGRAS